MCSTCATSRCLKCVCECVPVLAFGPRPLYAVVCRWPGTNQVRDHTGARVGASGNGVGGPWPSIHRPDSPAKKITFQLGTSRPSRSPRLLCHLLHFHRLCCIQSSRKDGDCPVKGVGGGCGSQRHPGASAPENVGFFPSVYMGVCVRLWFLFTVCVLLLITEVTEIWR